MATDEEFETGQQKDQGALRALANRRGFVVQDVLDGGNCLFSAVSFGLSNLGLHRIHQELRADVAAYLGNNPYSSDGSTYLRDYISTRFVNPDFYNSDTEQPSQIDMDIDQVSDATEQANRRWEQYLTGLAGSAWGEHIAVQGLANMLQVNIDIICTANPRDEPVTHISCSGPPVGTVTIGLVGQFHFKALETVQTPPAPVISAHLQRDDKDTETDDLESEKEETEVFKAKIQPRGLPYESGLYNEEPQTNAHTIYSIAHVNTLFNTFLKSPAHPLGELLDYAVRIEFQARGSPHAHAILWIKDTPQLGQGSDAEVCEFIDRYVQSSIPEDSDFAKFVTKSQMHRH